MKSIDEFVVQADKMLAEYTEVISKQSNCECDDCYKADRPARDRARLLKLAMRDFIVLGLLRETEHG